MIKDLIQSYLSVAVTGWGRFLL